MKTVRFAQVVERSGAPELHPLWTAPEKDAEFQRAVKAGRVMTLTQANVGSKRDRGVIGYEPGERAQFLVFPKSLKPFGGRDVIGVKYELLHEPTVKEPYHAPAPKPKKRAKPELQVRIVDDDEREVERNEEKAGGGKVVAFEHPHPSKRGREAGAPTRVERARPTPRETKFSRGAEQAANEADKRLATLVAEAKRALKELKQGKAVAAYERLARAVSGVEKAT